MKEVNRKEHWENIYSTKKDNQVSWTQENPEISMNFIESCGISKNSSIIDVGAGNSRLVDKLIEAGFEDITILDISEHALERVKNRLGDHAKKVNWVVADITQYETSKSFDLWHDRAAFHFLTKPSQIKSYLNIAKKSIKNNGYMTLGTFSDNGPKKCSGLEITQYSENTLQKQLGKDFKMIKNTRQDHKTPFDTTQNFLFCSFRYNPSC